MTIDKSEKFTWLVRLGFATRGLVYLLLGYLALSTAGAAKEGSDSVFDYLQDIPMGGALLAVMAIGLFAYAVFRFLSAIADIQNKGSDTKGWLARTGDFVSGVAHVILAYAAYQFATGGKRNAEGGASQDMAGSVLDMELGAFLIGIFGLGFLVGAVMQVKQVITAKFMNRMSGSAPSWTKPVGQVGHAARAIVFAIIGYSLVRGAWLSSEGQVKGLGEAILSLRGMGILFTFVAIGLAMYGLFSLLTARYRIIPDVAKDDLKPSLH